MTSNTHHSIEDMPVATTALHGSAVILLVLAVGQLIARLCLSLECLHHEGLASAVTALIPAFALIIISLLAFASGSVARRLAVGR